MRTGFMLFGFASVLFLAAGCARPGVPAASGNHPDNRRTIEIGLKEYAFEPRAVTVRPGEQVRFILTNRGTQDHEFEGEKIGIEETIVPPGKKRETTWTAPTKTGTYEVVCDLPGHREKGMVFKLTVAE